MNDPQFSTWWDYAKNLNEFRGHTMAAAYAAWLAGKASVNGSEIATASTAVQSDLARAHELVPEKVVTLDPPDEIRHPTELRPSKRRVGKFRAEEA